MVLGLPTWRWLKSGGKIKKIEMAFKGAD